MHFFKLNFKQSNFVKKDYWNHQQSLKARRKNYKFLIRLIILNVLVGNQMKLKRKLGNVL
jgi:hypothetical protein